MTVCYCALWMPTIIHQDFEEPYFRESKIMEISDSVSVADGDSKLYVKLLMKNNHDIQILIYKDDGYRYNKQDDSLTLTLCYIDHSHNGMFYYSVEAENAHHPLIYNEATGLYRFPGDLYHGIKEFYHKHAYHKVSDGDSTILPFVSLTEIDIKQADNEVLCHYLKLYEDKFINYFEYLQYNFSALINGGLRQKILFFFGWRRHHSFYRIATRLKGDKTYYNSLYMSCYNTKVRLERSNPDDTEEEKAHKRRAFNIENIVQSVDIMEDRIDNQFGLTNARISFWIALIAIFISVITFILSR